MKINTRPELILDFKKRISQLREISWFLNQVHPNNIGKGECFELRPVNRGNKKDFLLSKNIWCYDKKGLLRIKSFLSKNNGKLACLYYSVFTYDYFKETFSPDNIRYKKGYINNQNAKYTQILVMDFDNMSFKHFYSNYKSKFDAIGIETIIIETGHGFQAIILLNEKVYDKDILLKFTNLLLRKGFKVDSKIVDSARVMRLPNTFNCKEFDPEYNLYSKDNPKALFTKILFKTEKRYSCDEIFKKIEESFNDDPEYSPVIIKTTLGDNDYSKFVADYNMLEVESLPPPIQRMLFCTKLGLRNSVMMYLLPYFKNTLNLNKEQIINIMTVWGRRCSPAISPDAINYDINRLWKYYTNCAYGTYSEELYKEFGSMLKYTLIIDKRLNKLIIPNVFFLDYDKMPDLCAKIFISMKYFEKANNRKLVTIHDLIRFLKISSATFYRNIKYLLAKGFVKKIKSIKRNKESYTYCINDRINLHDGYTTLDISATFWALTNINSGEFKTLLYMYRMGNTSYKCWARQEKLGEYVGKKKSTICHITNHLNHKGFIVKTYLSDYCDNNNIKVKNQTLLQSDKFLDFAYHCYKEDKSRYKRHCIYCFDKTIKNIAS